MNDRVSHLPASAAPPPLAGQPDAALPAGMRLGAFELHRVLSRSASAVVYLATDHALAMPVAIQEYLPARLVRRDAGLRLVATGDWHEALIARGLSAFVDDSRMLARCDHPSLVRVHQLFHSHGSAYRVMPLYAGRRLSELRGEMDAAPDETSLRALLDGLLGALEAVHRSGQFHGGVSADNILLLDNDRPLLLGPGTAAREIGSDLVESLMATLEPPPDAQRTTAPDAGTPPTGAALDLYRLAEVVRFCIAAEPASSAPGLRLREPLARVIAQALPAGARPAYSSALLGALDAAVSPYAEDRPLSVAQFRDWLARGVPAVPGRGPASTASPPAASPPPSTPSPMPTFEPHAEPAAPVAGRTEASFGTPAPEPALAPLPPWPEVVRAIDPAPADFADAGTPPPLPPQLQRLSKSRQRGYQWLLGVALALLAVVVLAVATGAWNLAPEIPLGPQVGGPALSPPPTSPAAPLPHATRPAEAPATPALPPSPATDPAGALATEPPSAGPASSSASAVIAASPAPATAPAPAPPVAAQPAPIASPAPAAPSPPVRRTPPPRTAAAAPVATPRMACAGRTEFALYRCMQQQCQAARFSTHPQCIRLRLDDRVD